MRRFGRGLPGRVRLRRVHLWTNGPGSTQFLFDLLQALITEVDWPSPRYAMTDLGNQLQIRHFESGKDPVDDADVDYLSTRMAAFVLHVLRATRRLAA